MNALVADLGPALAALPAQQRAVIELHYFGGLSFPAIARQAGEPLETIKSRARLGLERLRRALAPQLEVKLGAIPKP
jgi:RNA polymerase sigma-70 factor (ECF subfamily)